MGNSSSTIDRGKPKLTATARNKLCKPRVGRLRNRRRILYLFPGAKVSKQRYEPTNWACCPAPEQHLSSRVSSDPDAETTQYLSKSDNSNLRHSSSTQSRHPSSRHSRNSSVCESSYDTCQANSRRNSTLMPKTGPGDLGLCDPSSVVRRRSQIFAAPPATKTRRQQIPNLEGTMPVSQLFALDLADADRSETPSGYPVLGVFKRGSLRIVNRVASPSPPIPDARPKRRNSSPTSAGAPVRAVATPTPPPQLTVSPHEDQGYFGLHAGTQASGVIINGGVTVKESLNSVSGAPHSPEVIPHTYNTPCVGDLHESSTYLASPTVGCLSSHPMVLDEPEITPLEDKLLLLQSVSSSKLEQLPSKEAPIITSCNPVISPDNKSILRRASSVDNISCGSPALSSSNSNALELRGGSGYFRTKNFRASRSWYGRVMCCSCGWDTCCEDGTDMYISSVEQEESNGGGITTSFNTRVASLALYDHSIMHNQSLTKKLPNVASNSNLKLPESPPPYTLPEKQCNHKSSPPGSMDTVPRPDAPKSKQLTARGQIPQWPDQTHIGTAHSRINTSHAPYNQQPHLCVPLKVPSYTGAEYYHRFALRRQQPIKRICG